MEFVKKNTDRQIKIPIPGPYMLTRSSWFEGLSDQVYGSVDELAQDVVKILREEILALKERGADFIQLDNPSLAK